MTTFADLLHKMANNARLTPQELDELKRYGTETQQRNSFVAGNTSAENNLNIQFPFFLIFSEVLHADTSSLTIQIPPDFKHIILIMSGRTTTNNSNYNGILCSFNLDTGTNYVLHRIAATGTTTTNALATGQNGCVVSFFANAGNPSSELGSSLCLIPHYKSSLYKNAFSYGGVFDESSPYAYLSNDTWKNSSIIQSLYLRSVADNITAGSSISVYGIL